MAKLAVPVCVWPVPVTLSVVFVGFFRTMPIIFVLLFLFSETCLAKRGSLYTAFGGVPLVEHFFNRLKDQYAIPPIFKSCSSTLVVKESEKAVAGLGRQEHISNYNAILGRKTSKIDIDDVGSSKDQSSQVDDKSKKVRSSAHSSTLDASNAQLHRKRKLLQEKEDAVAKEAGPQAALDRVVKTATRIASRPVVDKRKWFKKQISCL
ncbi:uncharacterized protein LOC110612671 [Manihot esculenta]|uniref:uncharacterized protein LOC110612671 n=1 Tax=Manihot esculenta TaxID=3983 RepID=UPI001CC6F59D|nr:uncharacterized protein LOC110612671 [Manihot esculenta]